MTITLTVRDHELLDFVTGRVTILARRQIEELQGFPKRQRATQRWLDRLCQSGLLERHVINAHPLLPIERPLFAWKPAADDPDPSEISRAARRRWCLAAQPTEVYVASRLAANLLGSTAHGLPAPEHRDHDLRLAAVFAHYRRHRPRLARLWVGEHLLPKAGYRIKDPDAFLCDAQGQIVRVIESAGRYSAEQVEAFHEHCVEHELSYELW